MSLWRARLPGARTATLLFAAAGLVGLVISRVLWPAAEARAFAQTWPPFVLVSGLLLVGLVAQTDGILEGAGAFLTRVPGGALALYISLMTLVALVTVVLNLDTSVVFLTPIVISAARRSDLDESAFLYGVVFMSNSASLLLPGSNLTNLLVLYHAKVSGLAFAERMWPAWLGASAMTAAVVAVAFRRGLSRARFANGGTDGRPHLIGLLGTAAAAVLVIVLRSPAVPVLLLGLALVGVHLGRGKVSRARVAESVDVVFLFGVFAAAVGLATLARIWGAPARLMASAGRWASAGIGAIVSAGINNLPAAVALAARPPLHPGALLVGLDVGPNLVLSGSLAGILWFRAARSVGARPSALTYSKIGVMVGAASVAAAVLALGLVSMPRT